MVGRRRTQTGDKLPLASDRSPGEADLNEVVAYNFKAARELRGLTQEETAQLLERSLGQRLPQASISAIERLTKGTGAAKSTPMSFLAFALAFDLPLVWFFLPPPGGHPPAAPHVQLRGRAVRGRLRP